MRLRTVYLILVAAISALGTSQSALTNSDLKALDGEWVYVEDRTAGRPLEQLAPPMGSKFTFRIEDGKVILVWGHGGGRKDVPVKLDGSVTEFTDQQETARYSGTWKDGTFEYQVQYLRGLDKTPSTLIRRDFRVTAEGLIVRSAYSTAGSVTSPPPYNSIGLYRHEKDIPMPTPAKAVIADLAWLSGNWSGTRGTGGAISLEERWSPPKGGAMLAVSRSVNTSGKMSAFEFLRIVERDGGLVYIAQPGGAPPTEFVLTELSKTRAVFDNPRHDYPKRIVYEVLDGGGLTASIGYIKGGTPRKFEFKRDGG